MKYGDLFIYEGRLCMYMGNSSTFVNQWNLNHEMKDPTTKWYMVVSGTSSTNLKFMKFSDYVEKTMQPIPVNMDRVFKKVEEKFLNVN